MIFDSMIPIVVLVRMYRSGRWARDRGKMGNINGSHFIIFCCCACSGVIVAGLGLHLLLDVKHHRHQQRQHIDGFQLHAEKYSEIGCANT